MGAMVNACELVNMLYGVTHASTSLDGAEESWIGPPGCTKAAYEI